MRKLSHREATFKSLSGMQGSNYSAESRPLGSCRSGWCLYPICARGADVGIAKAILESVLCCSGFPIFSIEHSAKQAQESMNIKIWVSISICLYLSVRALLPEKLPQQCFSLLS